MTAVEPPRIVRVRPDEAAIAKTFDYSIPSMWSRADQRLAATVGTRVRIGLHGRRLAGWVVAVDVEPPPGVSVRPLAKLSGWGPSAELIGLAEWAAWRWAGSVVGLMGAASPPTIVGQLPLATPPPSLLSEPVDPLARQLGERLSSWRAGDGPLLVEAPPSTDELGLAIEVARRGPVLVIAPSVDRARELTVGLRRAGIAAGLAPRDWARGRAGASMVGARAAAWAPVEGLAGIVVVDEHDEAHQDERTPTWNARDVALERARRAAVPCVLTSPIPTLEAMAAVGPLISPSRVEARNGWALTQVIDRRRDDPRSGLLSERLTPWLKVDGPVVCVLNRTGRSRLMACSSCGELVRCQTHDRALLQSDDGLLTCPVDGEQRPVVCEHCGSTVLKNLRAGVARVREELEALSGRPVADVTAATDTLPDAEIHVGTEAVLHRVRRAAVVVFLDFDQELLAPRYRASEQALALLVRAARLLGPRDRGGRLVVQTRQPRHPALLAVLQADPAVARHADDVQRRALLRPPYSAEARVSGASAPAFMERFGRPETVTVLGPVDGAYLLRAPTSAILADALMAVERPPGRVRVEVDPPRI